MTIKCEWGKSKQRFWRDGILVRDVDEAVKNVGGNDGEDILGLLLVRSFFPLLRLILGAGSGSCRLLRCDPEGAGLIRGVLVAVGFELGLGCVDCLHLVIQTRFAGAGDVVRRRAVGLAREGNMITRK